MRVSCRLVLLVLTGILGAAVACGGGDSSGPTGGPASVTGVAGNGQEGPTGAQLAVPLSFVVLNSSGQPVNGVDVAWSVSPAGGATFSPASGKTDASGNASTIVTLGAVVGTVNIQATVSGISPVQFQAIVRNPCDVSHAPTYTLGTTINGTLSANDCHVNIPNFGTVFYDFYLLSLPAGQQSLRANMTSSVFDTYLELVGTPGFVGFSDDLSQGITNSQIDVIIGPGGNVLIAANSSGPGETGAYTLNVSTRPATLAGCAVVWVTRGVTINDALTTSDCPPDADFGPGNYETAVLFNDLDSVLTTNARSTSFNTMLRLFGPDPGGANTYVLVASNDDSAATTTNSHFVYTAGFTAPYVLYVGSAVAGGTGAYTLVLAPSTTTPSAPLRAPRITELWPADVFGSMRRWSPLPAWQRRH